jgi:hypothetical protein
MNNGFSDNGHRRLALPRLAGILAPMACITVLVAACGGSGSSASGPQTNSALVYARCMRSHGVLNFPDPDGQGNFPPFQPNVSRQVSDSAQTACRSVDPNRGSGDPGTAQQQQSKLVQGLNYSRCMRAHGVPNFPDPGNLAGGGMGYNLNGIDANSPQYRSAQGACRAAQQKS